MWTVGPAFFKGATGATCPSYSTVTLSLTNVAYTPPAANYATNVMSLLPCPYTPPTVV